MTHVSGIVQGEMRNFEPFVTMYSSLSRYDTCELEAARSITEISDVILFGSL